MVLTRSVPVLPHAAVFADRDVLACFGEIGVAVLLGFARIEASRGGGVCVGNGAMVRDDAFHVRGVGRFFGCVCGDRGARERRDECCFDHETVD